AHRGALRVGGRTIAVLGCGLARCYPPEHRRLFERIVERGSSLLSEHPMLAPPLGHHFPRRNRRISGLSLGVLIVAAARRSAALITARLAAEDHGRAVMALPGLADSPAAAGGLRAVRDGWAALVLDDEDVWHQLEGAGHLVRGALELAARTGASSRADDLTDEQSRLLTAVRGCDGGVPADRLAVATARPVGPMLADLTVLEVRGLVVRGADGLVHRADGA
ncbi:MAG: DNA-processing protein DprA, partial [Planctomycetota bacterium]